MPLTGFSSGFSGINSFAVQQSVQADVQRAAVRLVNAPRDIQNAPRPTSVQGEVVSQPTEKSFLIRTDRGDIEVRPRGGQRFEVGQTVKLDIPAGGSARDVLATRVESENNANQTRTNLGNLAKGEKAVQLSRDPAIKTALLNEASRNSTVTQRAGDLPEGSLVRLKVLPQKVSAALLSEAARDIIKVNLALADKIRANVTQDGQARVRSQIVAQNAAFPALPFIPSSPATAQLPSQSAALIANILGLSGDAIDFQAGRARTIARIPVQLSGAGVSLPNQTGGITRFARGTGQAIQSTALPQGQINMGGAFATVKLPRIPQGQGVLTSQTPTHSVFQNAQIDGRVSYGAQAMPQHSGILTGGAQHLIVSQGLNTANFQINGMTKQGHVLLQPFGGGFEQTQGALSGQSTQTPPVYLMNYPMKNPVIGQVLQISPLAFFNASATGLAGLDSAWESLFTNLFKTGTHISPVLQALQGAMPSVTSPMQNISSLMFLMAAFQGGNVDGLVGAKGLQVLKNDKILKAFETALKEGGTTPKLLQTGSGEWRGYSLPLHQQDNFVPIHLYVQDFGQQQNNQGNSEDEGADATRFVFEFDLTRMGELQIDGMMRNTNLDIFVRTEKPISTGMAKGMKALYTRALERSELTGDIAFQTKDKGWVDLVPVNAPRTGADTLS